MRGMTCQWVVEADEQGRNVVRAVWRRAQDAQRSGENESRVAVLRPTTESVAAHAA